MRDSKPGSVETMPLEAAHAQSLQRQLRDVRILTTLISITVVMAIVVIAGFAELVINTTMLLPRVSIRALRD